MFTKHLPSDANILGMPDSGFFYETNDYGNFSNGMFWIYNEQNSTNGLNSDCINFYQKNNNDLKQCIFAQNTGYIQ